MPIDTAKARQILDEIDTRTAALRSLLTDAPPVQGGVIRVKVGDDLQKALDAAKAGDTIRVQPGTYKGNYLLRKRPGTDPADIVTIRPDVEDGNLAVKAGRWITPDFAPALVKLQSGDGITEALRTDPGAHGFLILGLDIPPVEKSHTMVSFGLDKAGGQVTLDAQPWGIVVDRCYFHGDPTPGIGQHRAIAANCGSLIVRASYFGDIFEVGRDAQAICGWNGFGPFVIENNYIEASGENVMFGGAGPGIPNLIPTDITIRHNFFTKNLAWKSHPTPPTVKNDLELKNAMKVLIENNVFENSWPQAQSHPIIFKAVNADTFDTWSICADVVMQYNLIRKVAGFLNIHNTEGNGPTQGTHRLTIRHNLAFDINETFPGGDGRAFLIGSGPEAVAIDHNTILTAKGSKSNSFLTLYDKGDVIKGGKFTNNIVREGQYGMFGSGSAAMGLTTFRDYYPDGTFKGNAIEQGGVRTIDYGPDNMKIGAGQLDSMLDTNRKPNAGSLLAGVVTTDGLTVGADVAQILSRVGDLL